MANTERMPGNRKMCYVYVLACADGSLYTGWCCSLERRLQTHRRGRGSKYVRSRLPFQLAAFWAVPNPASARKQEAAFKRLKRPAKLELIKARRTKRPL